MNYTKNVCRILLALMTAVLLTLPIHASDCVHQYESHRQDPTCDRNGMTWRECIHCGDTIDYGTLPPLGHTFQDWYVLVEPTCTRDGTQVRSCMVCGFQETAALSQRGHNYIVDIIPPTCTARGYTDHTCVSCGDQFRSDYTEARGHTFDAWYVLKEPTCTRDGSQARDCTVCGHQEKASLPQLGHDYIVEVMPPTCTARGYTSHYCPACGDRFRTDYTESLGHRYDGGVIVSEPTLTAMGRIRYTCTGCGDTYQETIPKLTNPFKDINKQAYYFTPVIWAVNSGITSGLDETHFGPDELCNRAQAVTFLWRCAGKPEPKISTNPFLDVPRGSFYEKAVLWAYEKGITTGTDARHFTPEATCNRAQAVTFLHRFRGCPTPSVTTAFPDVQAGSFYHKAVLWAAQRGITVGMDGGCFCPDLQCSRAQIVTFLYRDAKNP